MPALVTPKQEPLKFLYVESVGTSVLSMPWFVKSTQAAVNGIKPYVPRKGFIRPLINGKAAFGEVEKAIMAATKTIDYVTWGFDPSMRLSEGGKPVGQLLLDAAQRGVKVRMLLWYGGSLSSSMLYGKSDGGKTSAGEEHTTANLPGYDANPGEASKYTTSADWYKKIKKQPNIELHLRELNDTADLRGAIQNNPYLKPLDSIQEQGMRKVATHHQKMVLVDYVLPESAKGFVLGSNTLPRYWDTDDHPIEHNNRRMDYIETVVTDTAFDGTLIYKKQPASVKLGPWQDISAYVLGAILFDLNANFASAWKREGGSALEAQRDQVTPAQLVEKGPVTFIPMQVVRTQSQENDHSISDVYFQNVLNARGHIYLENQYFRLPELAAQLDKAAGKLSSWGRKENLHVFVVTNIPTDKYPRLNTYRMLSALGKSNQMPQMHTYTQENPKKAIQPLPSVERKVAGLKSVVCTLIACEGTTPQNLRYAPIYVHSKLMTIDDGFFTLGSANLNARSMASDSELNVAVPNAALTEELRLGLWRRHRGVGTKDDKGVIIQLEADMKKEFQEWEEVSRDNLGKLNAKTTKQPLVGRLTKFYDNGGVVTIAYD